MWRQAHHTVSPWRASVADDTYDPEFGPAGGVLFKEVEISSPGNDRTDPHLFHVGHEPSVFVVFHVTEWRHRKAAGVSRCRSGGSSSCCEIVTGHWTLCLDTRQPTSIDRHEWLYNQIMRVGNVTHTHCMQASPYVSTDKNLDITLHYKQ